MSRLDQGKKIYVKTFGCSMNISDSESMIGILKRESYTLTSDISVADIVIVNTCGVKTPTEHRILSYLRKLSKLGKPVIVSGCLPSINLPAIKKAIPNFAAIIGTEEIIIIDTIVNRVLSGEHGIIQINKAQVAERNLLQKERFSSVYAIIPISSGCLGNCAYCAVRFARGELKSYPIENIVREISFLVKKGYKEFWLTSQDTGVYGFDRGLTLVDLLEKIIHIEGKFKIRIGMMNPSFLKLFYKSLVPFFKNEKVYRFLHIPVQSGSDRILQLMRRGYTVEEFYEIVSYIKSQIPDITLSTDIIVGYPGETDEDFGASVDLVKRIRPDIVNISKFGKRPNTIAAKMETQIPESVKSERSRYLSKLVNQISYENNLSWINWEGEILISSIAKYGNLMGRNYAYKPIFVTPNSSEEKTLELKIGETKKVRINRATSRSLFGILVN